MRRWMLHGNVSRKGYGNALLGRYGGCMKVQAKHGKVTQNMHGASKNYRYVWDVSTSHNNSDFICTPIAPPATSAPSYEIKPALPNLVMKDQFSGAGEDVALHLNNFVELCDMEKYKEVDGDIVKLKLFPFSLRRRAKEWLQSLPRNSIDSWDKCKDAFIGKYYPPAMIIQLRSNIMNFRQLDNEHVAQTWEHMKSLVKNFPTHGLTTWMVIQTFYAGLNFTSWNLLHSAAGGTFMSTTLGAATKLLDEMMTNLSQPTNR